MQLNLFLRFVLRFYSCRLYVLLPLQNSQQKQKWMHALPLAFSVNSGRTGLMCKLKQKGGGAGKQKRNKSSLIICKRLDRFSFKGNELQDDELKAKIFNCMLSLKRTYDM